ncbi:malate:quinone oxidoreductase, partial [Pseudomonas syringae pv. tagetis]
MCDDVRFAALEQFFPKANKEVWRVMQAGQRVQIIGRVVEIGGVRKLGTEFVASTAGSRAGR